MDNRSNLAKYRRLAPIYDWFMTLGSARKKSWALLPVAPGDKILLCGVGTGLDFDFMPATAKVTGIDLSEDMLARARRRVGRRDILLRQMNAEALSFPDAGFDAVVLSLILSVAGSAEKVFSESLRVLKPGGKILIWDKFAKSAHLHWSRKALNVITSGVGTDITRNLEQIIAGRPVKVIKDQGNLFGGNYRSVLMEKV